MYPRHSSVELEEIRTETHLMNENVAEESFRMTAVLPDAVRRVLMESRCAFYYLKLHLVYICHPAEAEQRDGVTAEHTASCQSSQDNKDNPTHKNLLLSPVWLSSQEDTPLSHGYMKIFVDQRCGSS